MGYAGNKVAIKDAFATYSYKNSSIQIGQFYEPFSLDMICSTFDLRFNQSPGAVLALTNSRRMGVAYSIVPNITICVADSLPIMI